MFKRLKKEPIAALLLVVVFSLSVMAATWNMSITRLTSLWVGSSTDTSTQTVGDDDVYIKGHLEVDGVIYTDGGIDSVVRYYQLPLLNFLGSAEQGITEVGSILTTSTVPGITTDDGVINLVWADTETSVGVTTFRIPADYASGGAFKVIATQSASSTKCEVDFNVLVNTSGSTIDSSATGQTPVQLTTLGSTPSEITLTPATDFASLAAGDWVTLRIWRDDAGTNAGTNDLEVKGVAFYYTAIK